LDYADFALIVALLLVNATISFIEESNADKAIKVCDESTHACWLPHHYECKPHNVLDID
jgi:hypothetical protein